MYPFCAFYVHFIIFREVRSVIARLPNHNSRFPFELGEAASRSVRANLSDSWRRATEEEGCVKCCLQSSASFTLCSYVHFINTLLNYITTLLLIIGDTLGNLYMKKLVNTKILITVLVNKRTNIRLNSRLRLVTSHQGSDVTSYSQSERRGGGSWRHE